MLERMKKLQKEKRGFTLVELIVVLIILTILAALLLPALSGYIKKAQEKQVIAETRQIVMAIQTVADELYVEKGDEMKAADITYDDIKELVEVKDLKGIAESGDGTNGVAGFTMDEENKAKVDTVTWKKGEKTCTYNAAEGTYDVP